MFSLSYKFRTYWLTAILCAYLLIVMSWWYFPAREFRVSVLDVGQGDSILVQTPGFNQILIDGGPGDKVIEELAKKLPYFNQRLDLVVLSHPHNDHVEGLVSVLNRFEVDRVMLSGIEKDLGSYEEFLKVVDEKDIEVIFADADKDFYFGDTVFDILYPLDSMFGLQETDLHDGDANNASIVMRVSFKGFSVLLTGDAEKPVEEELIELGMDLSADVLKAGHHGSKTSSTEKFIDAVNPEKVIFNVGKNNRHKHPHAEVVERFERRGVEILRTDELGTFSLSWSGDG